MASFVEQLETVEDRVAPPVVIVLGSVGRATALARQLARPDTVCFQMDLYQAERLRENLAAENIPGRVEVLGDLWDLPADFQTVLYPVSKGSERELKIDMVEQAFHVLRPRGNLMILSPFVSDELFPVQLKKVFGKAHSVPTEDGKALWAARNGDRSRRRHELAFQARLPDCPSCRFLSRPGTFAYGRFDAGARALMEVAEISDGDRVLDLGCGCGTNGVFAAQRAGLASPICFVDSNLRATALADHNARANGLTNFQVIASSDAGDLPPASFDVVLANPPYFAVDSIATLFVERARALLRPKGRCYLVTRQPHVMAPVVATVFREPEEALHRGYTILIGEAP